MSSSKHTMLSNIALLLLLSTGLNPVLALQCYVCDDGASNCQQQFTNGWTAAQILTARCMIAYGDGRVATQQLRSSDECFNPSTAQQIKDSRGFSGVSVACCSDNLCNSDWASAGGVASVVVGSYNGFSGGRNAGEGGPSVAGGLLGIALLVSVIHYCFWIPK